MSQLWGIDLGGTKVEGVVLDSSYRPIARRRIQTEADRGYEHIVQRIHQLIRELEVETGTTRGSRIGIGTPGTADPATGLMKNCNTTALNGKPLPKDLRNELGIEILIANDANCFALAEATLGSANGAGVVFGVIMGTGVGGGLVVNGRVLAGAQGIAGEWGHNLLEPGGQPCYCGKVGCVETVLSGPALERFYFARSGFRRSLKEIASAKGDDHADATMSRLWDKFGQGLSVVVNIVDPDAVVLGGGVGNIVGLQTHGRIALERYVFNTELRTELLPPALGDSAGVFGAAMLVA